MANEQSNETEVSERRNENSRGEITRNRQDYEQLGIYKDLKIQEPA